MPQLYVIVIMDLGTKPHEMAVQVSRSVHSEVPQKDATQAAEALSGGGVPGSGEAEGEPDRGGVNGDQEPPDSGVGPRF